MRTLIRAALLAPIVLAILALASFGDARADDPAPIRTPLLKPTGRSEFIVRIDLQAADTVDDTCRSLYDSTRAVDAPAVPNIRSRGCSVWHNVDERAYAIDAAGRYPLGRLDLYVVEPVFIEDTTGFAIIGHEVWHGMRGPFHGNKPADVQ